MGTKSRNGGTRATLVHFDAHRTLNGLEGAQWLVFDFDASDLFNGRCHPIRSDPPRNGIGPESVTTVTVVTAVTAVMS